MLQDEYFVIERENNDDYPLFSWDQQSGEIGLGRPVTIGEPLKLRLGEPIPPNPVYVDYHSVPYAAVSKRIVDVLAPLDIYGIQLLPAKVRNPEDPQSKLRDYWIMHVWNRISCLDRVNSDIECDEVDGGIWGIDKLVLNERTLAMFDLKKRQIFELAEKTSVLLIHKSIKDAIESTSARGYRFFKAADWNSDSTFS